MPATARASRPGSRRTQEERSRSTRSRLLDATIECLFEKGYAGTTTTEIAERAGVSRGAQLYHFPTKADLVTTAVEHLFQRRDREFREALGALPPGTGRATQAIDLLWSMISGPTFYAWLELLVAARTDPELRRTVSGIARRFEEQVERTFRDLFPRPDSAGPWFDIAPAFTFALLEGLALQRIACDDPARGERVLAALRSLATSALSAANPSRRKPR